MRSASVCGVVAMRVSVERELCERVIVSGARRERLATELNSMCD